MVSLSEILDQSGVFSLAALAFLACVVLAISMRSERRLRSDEGADPPSVWVPFGFFIVAVVLTVVGIAGVMTR